VLIRKRHLLNDKLKQAEACSIRNLLHDQLGVLVAWIVPNFTTANTNANSVNTTRAPCGNALQEKNAGFIYPILDKLSCEVSTRSTCRYVYYQRLRMTHGTCLRKI
jgi:hypothetical protein